MDEAFFSASTGTKNADSNSYTTVFTIKDTKSKVYVIKISQNQQNQSKRLSKEFKSPVYWNEYKTKSEIKDTTKEYRYFSESNFVEVKKLFAVIYSN